MKKQQEAIDQDGAVKSGKLNQLIEKVTIRPDGSRRIQWDYEFCPSMAEQGTGHLTDINFLMERYKPDELAAYLAARSQVRKEITGHDFSTEPSLQDAKNIIYNSKQAFNNLSDDVKGHFANHLEFLKFIDNPANADKLVKLGLATPRELEAIKIPEQTQIPAVLTATESSETKHKNTEALKQK